jgi:hypothetical protein
MSLATDGNTIYTYSELTRTGGNYVPFPDPRHHEIKLDSIQSACRVSVCFLHLYQVWHNAAM